MKQSLLLFAALVVVAMTSALLFAGQDTSDPAYQKKLWANVLLLSTKLNNQQINALLELPHSPVEMDRETGGVVVRRSFFWREVDDNGRPMIGVLYQVTDSAALNAVNIYNASAGAMKK